jgi:hypothetical protein
MAVSKKTGKKSLAANDFLIPLPPGPPTANDVGTNRPFDNGSAVVEFSPVDLAVSYKIYAAASGQTTVTNTGTSSPIIVTGLKSNILYTFTVTGFNDQGVEGDPSDPSTPTLITTVPATPAAPTASSPNANQDIVSWLIPATGGKTITGYIWTASDGKTNLSGGNPGGGPTANLSVTVNQEAGSAQTYTVYAINANGNSAASNPSNNITTTFSFAPFGFSPFGFSPFMVFSFSPFMVFSFSPFMVFMFTPFSFAPFMVFSFAPAPPRCIYADTKLATINKDNNLEWVKAKDIKVGTKVFSPFWDEFKSDDIETPYESTVTYDSMTDMRIETGEIVFIKESTVEKTIIVNDNPEKRFSSTQPVLVDKKDTMIHGWVFAGDLSEGDYVWEYDFDSKEFVKTLVNQVEIVKDEGQLVYAFDVEEIDTFVAAGFICHNTMKV